MRKLVGIGKLVIVLFIAVGIVIIGRPGTAFGQRSLTKATLVSPPLGTTLFEAKWDARVINLSTKPAVVTIFFCNSQGSCFAPAGLAGCSAQTLGPGETCDAQDQTTESDETRYVKIVLDGGSQTPRALGSLTMVTTDGMTTVEVR
jgi:hypothetical protein